MAQGTRGRWLRVAATGFGVVICTGLIGCMNTDKKDTKITGKQPTPGLPGLQQIPPGGSGANAMTRTGAPGTFNSPGVQPAGGFTPGAGAAPVRTGLNNNTSGSSQQYNYGAAPGAPGMISAPARTGIDPPSVSPGGIQPIGGIGGPVGMSPAGGSSSTAFSPAPPALDNTPLPPPPPHSPTAGASTSGAVMSPTLAPIDPGAPVAPVAPSMPPAGTTGKGPPLSFDSR